MAAMSGACLRAWLAPLACSLCSLTRVGVMVLVCHESNDIFLEAAKVRWGAAELANVAGFTNEAVLGKCQTGSGQAWRLEIKAAAVRLHLSLAVDLACMCPNSRRWLGTPSTRR